MAVAQGYMKSARTSLAALLFVALIPSSSVIGAWDATKYSQKFQALLEEAKQYSKLPVRIEPLSPEQSKLYQGRIEFRQSEIVVRIGKGYSPEHEEQILAHELFHVILFVEGFSKGYGFSRNFEGTRRGKFLDSVGSALQSCLMDVVIDERMSRRGFNPELLARRQIMLRREQIPEASRQDPLWLGYVALHIFCSSLRRGANLTQLQQLSEEVDPTMGNRVDALAAQFGRVSVANLDTPGKWFIATKHLRDAAGFRGIIQIVNPETLRPE